MFKAVNPVAIMIFVMMFILTTLIMKPSFLYLGLIVAEFFFCVAVFKYPPEEVRKKVDEWFKK